MQSSLAPCFKLKITQSTAIKKPINMKAFAFNVSFNFVAIEILLHVRQPSTFQVIADATITNDSPLIAFINFPFGIFVVSFCIKRQTSWNI